MINAQKEAQNEFVSITTAIIFVLKYELTLYLLLLVKSLIVRAGPNKVLINISIYKLQITYIIIAYILSYVFLKY